MNFNENIEKMVKDHAEMKSWHEAMAKSAADSMQDHIKAAAWHDSQSSLIKGMMNEVPLDPEKKVTNIPTGSYSPTPSAPTPSSVGPIKVGNMDVPMDPQTVKKMDLVNLLTDHAKQHGDFDMDVETIANFLINE